MNPFNEVRRYDVVIVGSGIAGALIAKRLCLQGFTVAIVEAGTELEDDRAQYVERYQASSFLKDHSVYAIAGNLNSPQPSQLGGNPDIWSDSSRSYLMQEGPLPFMTGYERVSGGSANAWLGISLRNVPNDFHMHSVYGVMTDWPLSYDDLEPWYCEAEHEIGVSGNVDDQCYFGIKFAAGYQYPMPPIPHSPIDRVIARKFSNSEIEGMRLHVRATPAARNSKIYNGRPACAGSASCVPICPIRAKYDPSVTLNDAMATGNLNIIYRSVAEEIIVNDNNQTIEGIRVLRYDDPSQPSTCRDLIKGRIVILACNAIETPKLLLMSKNGGKLPFGVANSTGLVGKYLMDHPVYLTWGLMDEDIFYNRGPLTTGGIEEFRDGDFRCERAAFRIEIGNDGWNYPLGNPFVTAKDFIFGSNVTGANPTHLALRGPNLKSTLRDILQKQFHFSALIEQTCDESNRVTLSNVKDHIGLPRPLINYNISDYTRKGLAAAKHATDSIFKQLGVRKFTSEVDKIEPNSITIDIDDTPVRVRYRGGSHIAGTTRMGSSRRDSVVDRNQRCWDHPNLFIVGSGTFPTIATANPTLTLAAMSLLTASAVQRELTANSIGI
jgi:glucose dehydrogenase